MSEIAGHRTSATAVVNESYSFACMRCGHGWEQSYEIEHHHDAEGSEFVMYVANGKVVPSPLSRPACLNCDGHVVRIMRAGQVSSARGDSLQRQSRRAAVPAQPTAPTSASAEEQRHHWHLSDLLHPFNHNHRKAG